MTGEFFPGHGLFTFSGEQHQPLQVSIAEVLGSQAVHSADIELEIETSVAEE